MVPSPWPLAVHTHFSSLCWSFVCGANCVALWAAVRNNLLLHQTATMSITMYHDFYCFLCASSWFSLICFPVEIACRYQLYISIPITQFFARRQSCLNQISAELSPRCPYRRWSCAHFTPSFFGKEKIDMKYRRFLAVSVQNKFRT